MSGGRSTNPVARCLLLGWSPQAFPVAAPVLSLISRSPLCSFVRLCPPHQHITFHICTPLHGIVALQMSVVLCLCVSTWKLSPAPEQDLPSLGAEQESAETGWQCPATGGQESHRLVTLHTGCSRTGMSTQPPFLGFLALCESFVTSLTCVAAGSPRRWICHRCCGRRGARGVLQAQLLPLGGQRALGWFFSGRKGAGTAGEEMGSLSPRN